MDKLSNELISGILDHIETDPDKIINVDKRAYLSVESFRAPEPPKPDQAQDVANFRRVCKRFADLGIRHQFTRLTTRFSKKGFKRLEDIAKHEHLGKHVRKFSYMIPFFYVEGREQIDELFRQFHDELSNIDSRLYKQKALDQQHIILQRIDIQALNKAMRAFTSLQHVQILRLQDEADRELLDCIRDNHETAPGLVDLRWTPACIHATRTMGEALLSARSPFTRFSGPMMSPLPPRTSPPTTSISSLASRLTCLELHFDDGLNLDSRMRELAPLFRTVFEAATNMQAVHVGFPSRAPLSLALEDIFHNIRWEKLRAFGIQAWKLDGSEIEGLARRHRKTLRGLRLRDVLLRSPSRWKDVLGVIRDEMEDLKWVSLRRIGYADYFDQNILGTMEVPDWVASDESDVEDGFPDQFSTSESAEDDDDDDDGGSDGSDADGEHDDEHDDEHGPSANQVQILSRTDHIPNGPDTPGSAPWCTCGSGGGTRDREVWNSLGKEQLGDSGESVAAEQRKMWEQWVVGRCIEHGRH